MAMQFKNIFKGNRRNAAPQSQRSLQSSDDKQFKIFTQALHNTNYHGLLTLVQES